MFEGLIAGIPDERLVVVVIELLDDVRPPSKVLILPFLFSRASNALLRETLSCNEPVRCAASW